MAATAAAQQVSFESIQIPENIVCFIRIQRLKKAMSKYVQKEQCLNMCAQMHSFEDKLFSGKITIEENHSKQEKRR